MTRKSKREVEQQLDQLEEQSPEGPLARYSIAELLSLTPVSESPDSSTSTDETVEESE